MVIARIKESKYRVLSWLICAFLCFGVEKIFAVEELFYDALDYWNRGESLWGESGFSLLNTGGFRGYVFPLFLGVCGHYGGKVGWQVMNAAMISSIFTIIVPNLSGTEKHMLNVERLDYKAFLHFFIFTILFVGLEIYPLSDVPAVFLCLSASYEIDCIAEDVTDIKRFLRCILFGFLVYSAYNVRTIYVFAAIYLIGYLSYKLYKCRTKVSSIVVTVIGGMVGFIITAIPQAYMNYHEHGKFSIKVMTDGLMTSQLLWGIQYQFFGTYVGDETLTSPALRFTDNVGAHILQSEGFTDTISLGQYLRICLKYPFEMLSIYGRHFINSILLYGPEAYVEKLDTSKVLVSLISFSCVFCLIAACLLGCIKNWKTIWAFMPALIPVICITPGAIESRFFVAMYLYIIGSLCYNCDWIKLKKKIKENTVKICFCYIGLYVCCLVTWTSMLSSLWTGYPIFFE